MQASPEISGNTLTETQEEKNRMENNTNQEETFSVLDIVPSGTFLN
jgi:hypothetical protein